MSKTVAQILAESREYMEKHGRCTGTMSTDDGRVCALGAITHSQGQFLDEDEVCDPRYGLDGAVKTLVKQIEKDYPTFEGHDFSHDFIAVNFNDRLCPSPEDDQKVLDMFAKAEKIALAGFDPDQGTEIES